MSIVRDQLFRVIHRARPRDFFPWLAVDEKKKLIFMERGYVGAILMCNTLYGADESVVQELSSALSIDFPAGTIIQAINGARRAPASAMTRNNGNTGPQTTHSRPKYQ